MSFGIPVRNGLAIGLLSSTTLSSNGGLFPAMALDFLQPFLDSRVTFTRGSNATLVDSTGKIVYAPANLVTYSEQFDNAAWIKYEGTVTANATTAPDGTTTADAFIESTTATTDHRLTFAGASAAVGQNLTLSVYAKANGRNFIALFSVTENKGKYFSIPADGTGAVLGDFGTAPNSAAISYVGNGWYRCSITYTATAASQNVRYYPCDTGATFIYTGNGTSGIFVWGAQLQPVTYQTTPSTYVATTSAAYYGPRFDYDPVTLAAKGLLIEEQRTNILLYSEQFNNVAGWSFFNATVTANVTASPDGTTNGDALVENATAGTHVCQQFVNYTSGTAYTFSVYVKAGTRNWVWLGLPSSAFSSGVSSFYNLTGAGSLGTASGSPTSRSITAAGNGWYRITITASATATAGGNTVIGSASADNTSFYTGVAAAEALYLYGADIEAGAFATSYIPTVASQVTRSADVATMTGTNFSSWFNATEGTFTFSGDSLYGSGGFIGSTPTTGAILYANNNASRTFNGTNFITSANTYTNNVVFGTALGYSASGRSIVLNGGTVATDANLIQTPTAITLGGAFGGGYLNGHIRSIAYYNTRLPNATLQALTA
jgi:hypothetical protein